MATPTPADRGVLMATKEKRGRKAVDSSAAKKGKGLRHFALRVCNKVEEKHVTTYNEVADDLVEEVLQSSLAEHANVGLDAAPRAAAAAAAAAAGGGFDEKNIRRRVYDALNVLMALGIIEKKKKDIRWIGLPSRPPRSVTPPPPPAKAAAAPAPKSSAPQRAADAKGQADELRELQIHAKQQQCSVEEKRARVNELQMQAKAITWLVRRNSMRAMAPEHSARVYLPFIMASTDSKTEIDLEIKEDREEVCFTFTDAFRVEDEQSILQRMGMLDAVSSESYTSDVCFDAAGLLESPARKKRNVQQTDWEPHLAARLALESCTPASTL